MSPLARMQAARRGLSAMLGRQCLVRVPNVLDPHRTVACLGRLVPGEWACLDCQKRLRLQQVPAAQIDNAIAEEATS